MDMAVLARNWGAIAIRGVAAILFGLLTFIVPGLTLTALVLLFGAYALVDGIFGIIAAIRRREGDRPWWTLIEGIVGVVAGPGPVARAGVSGVVLLYIIAAWAVVTGVLEIVAAVRLRRQITNEWWLALSGALSVVFGVLIMLAPAAGALAIALWIGAYAIVFGALL